VAFRAVGDLHPVRAAISDDIPSKGWLCGFNDVFEALKEQ
jgi:hypothetical protein